MSFIEKNKVWLLPLLGLGVLGVGYMNYRTFQEEPPAAPSEAVPAEAEPLAGEPSAGEVGPASAESGNPEGTEASADLWSDLRPFAVLPGNLAQETALRDRARMALGPELDGDPGLSLAGPAWASLAPPASRLPETATGFAPEGDGPPALDFLIHGPRGSFAWFGGRAYQVGEKVQGSGYTLDRIGPTFVELTGPRGRVVESTHPIPADGANPVEAP